MTRPAATPAVNAHVWDGNAVCQVHGGWCSMAPSTPPVLVGVDVDVDVDAPIPYLLTAAGLAVLDGPPAPTPAPAQPATPSPSGLPAAALTSRSSS